MTISCCPAYRILEKMRKNLGISQKEMAKMCGVSQSYIARITEMSKMLSEYDPKIFTGISHLPGIR